VDEGQLLMNQAERDRLDALKRAKKKVITQKQAAEEIGVIGKRNSLRSILYAVRAAWKLDGRSTTIVCSRIASTKASISAILPARLAALGPPDQLQDLRALALGARCAGVPGRGGLAGLLAGLRVFLRGAFGFAALGHFLALGAPFFWVATRAEQQKRDEEQRKAAQAEEQRKAAQAEVQRKASAR
jgi:hypothetical protein